jgi:ABC-type branched-subunit amino acid transport system substrate-binding protein
MEMTRHRWRVSAAAGLLCAALLMVGCGADGESADDEDEGPTTTSSTADGADADPSAFGELDEPPCGDGELTVDPDQAGGSDDVLRIGVANDRTADAAPGLFQVNYDASVAFAEWCNEQGGIGGLPIEVVDLDARVFDVEAAMTTACSEVFAMVGGGFAQDNLQFSGKDGSDFHRCDMIDLPGFVVSAEKGDSNGQVQALPNPGTTVANTWLRDYHERFPEADRVAIVWGELPSLEVVKNRYEAALGDIEGITVLDDQTYPAVGATDWLPYVNALIDSGANSVVWVGDVSFLSSFLTTARQQGWQGRVVSETNIYDEQLLAEGDSVEGTVARVSVHPLEEADRWPAVQKYLELVETYVPDGIVGAMGMHSVSAWLLFATAATACGEANDGVLERECVLAAAADVEDWTGGGLHAPQDPAAVEDASASPCGLLVVVEDGEFVRLAPELDGEDDDGAGFHCPEDGVSQVPANEGLGVVDPDRPT